MAERIGMCGLLDSGGGISHFPALMLAEYGRSGAYETNLGRLRNAYRERRDAMLGVLDEHLAGRATWSVPAGGYFLWLTLAGGRRATDLLPVAEAHGTTYVPGPVFHADRTTGGSSLRLAFSRHAPAEIAEAVRRLAAAVDAAG